MEHPQQPSPDTNVWLRDPVAAKTQLENGDYKRQNRLVKAINDKEKGRFKTSTSRISIFLKGIKGISYDHARYFCRYLFPNWSEKHWYKWLTTEPPVQASDDSTVRVSPETISEHPDPGKVDELTKQNYSFVPDKTRNFVGRQYVFDAFEKFKSARRSGYFALIGDPGEGKTTIAAKYVEDNRKNPYCLSFFAGRRAEGRDPVQFLQKISSQLIDLFGLRPEDIGLPNTSINDRYFRAILDAVSPKLTEIGKKIIIVVDALDEVNIEANPEDFNVLGLPNSLPNGVYFFLTHRRDSRLENQLQFDSIERFDFLKIPEETEIGKRILEDIREYIQRHLDYPERFDLGTGIRTWLNNRRIDEENFVKKLIEKSQRNFLYLTFVLPGFTKGGLYQNLEDLRTLPDGLKGYYQDHWQRMERICTRERWEIAIHILCVFTVAYEWVPAKRIADIATEVSKRNITTYEVAGLFKGWQQFIHERQELDEAYEYQLYHESYNDFASDYALKAAGLSRKEVSKLYSSHMAKNYDRYDDIDD